MALIPCPECKREVSTLAASCPHCGAPVVNFRLVSPGKETVVTTLLTSKRYKLQRLVALALAVIGWVIIIFGPPGSGVAGLILLIVSIGWSIVVCILIWWHHG